MSAKTGIAWTDATWNPVRGCSLVSAGCTNCYAMKQAHRFSGHGGAYEGLTKMTSHGPVWTGAARLVPNMLGVPMRWKKPRRIFVNSMSDLFHESLSNTDIAAVFGAMMHAPQHTFQVLTKRPERMREWFRWVNEAEPNGHAAGYADCVIGHSFHDATEGRLMFGHRETARGWPLPNVHLGVSVENQETADERITLLLQMPAAVRYISYEPALGSVDVRRWLAIDWQCSYCREFFSGRHKSLCAGCGKEGGWTGSHQFNGRLYPRGPISPSQRGSGLDWVIVGGESGPKARGFRVKWARSIVQQCRTAGVPVFVKQMGAYVIDRNDAGFDGCDDEAWPLRPGGSDPWVEYDIHGYIEEHQGADCRVRLKDRAGADPVEWPADLRVQQFPKALASAAGDTAIEQ